MIASFQFLVIKIALNDRYVVERINMLRYNAHVVTEYRRFKIGTASLKTEIHIIFEFPMCGKISDGYSLRTTNGIQYNFHKIEF